MNTHLDQSIKHYESNLAIFQKNKSSYIAFVKKMKKCGVEDIAKFLILKMRADGISWSGFDEPLCERYANYRILTTCWWCPVWKDDHSGCHGTPWEDLSYILNVRNQTPSVWMNLIEKAFINELEYLKGLSTKKFWR